MKAQEYVDLTDSLKNPYRLFRKAVQQGSSTRRGEAYFLSYVEPLSTARTPLADFVNSLLVCFLVMRQLIALAAFFRQHSLPCRRVCGNACHASLQGISLRPGGCTVAAFRDGCPDHSLVNLLIVLTALFSDHPRSITGIVRDFCQTGL